MNVNKNAVVAGGLIALLMVLLVVLGVVFLPDLATEVNAAFEPGIGLKTAAIISFVLVVVLFIVFAVVSEGGILGELQFMLAAFFAFFVIFTGLVAWIF